MAKNDSETTVEEMKNWVRAFCEERGWAPFHAPKDLAIGLVTESSELLELFRFRSEKEIEKHIDDPQFRENIADELADSLYFILRFSEMYGFDLSESVRQKLVKNAKKYPAK